MTLVGIPAEAEAASVVRIGSGKHFTIIDAGSADGLEAGDEVCFYTATNRKVGCGAVRRLMPHLAGVRVTSTVREALAIGMTAIVEGVAAAAKATHPKPTPNELAAAEAEAGTDEAPAPAQTPALGGRAPRRPVGELRYLYSALLPFEYHVPAYDVGAERAGSGRLWRQDRKVSSAAAGVELAAEVPLGPSLAVVPALHARRLPPDSLSVDYGRANSSLYAVGATSATSWGNSVDAAYALVNGEHGTADALVGLDVDQSQVVYEATEHGGAAEAGIAKLTSTLTVLSVRAGVAARYSVGRVAVGAGLAALLPVAGSPRVSQSRQALLPAVGPAQAAAAGADLQAALGHRRSRLGAAVTLTAAIKF